MWHNVVKHFDNSCLPEYISNDKYFAKLGRWLSAEENCIYMTNKHCLYFKDHRQLTMFILKWA
jgi:hypothetical protein